jgi:hypothetical protein
MTMKMTGWVVDEEERDQSPQEIDFPRFPQKQDRR